MRVHPSYFQTVYEIARANSDQIREATSPFADDGATDYFLLDDRTGGFAVRRSTGDLVYVFSTVRGQGSRLVRAALDRGAETLDCFDGYLPEFYARHGFVEYAREANWTPGGPDVVFMATPERLAR